jgi:hypothetical protein
MKPRSDWKLLCAASVAPDTAMRKTTDATHEEIKGLREDIQPGYATNFRQVQSDVRAIKERLGMH